MILFYVMTIVLAQVLITAKQRARIILRCRVENYRIFGLGIGTAMEDRIVST